MSCIFCNRFSGNKPICRQCLTNMGIEIPPRSPFDPNPSYDRFQGDLNDQFADIRSSDRGNFFRASGHNTEQRVGGVICELWGALNPMVNGLIMELESESSPYSKEVAVQRFFDQYTPRMLSILNACEREYPQSISFLESHSRDFQRYAQFVEVAINAFRRGGPSALLIELKSLYRFNCYPRAEYAARAYWNMVRDK